MGMYAVIYSLISLRSSGGSSPYLLRSNNRPLPTMHSRLASARPHSSYKTVCVCVCVCIYFTMHFSFPPEENALELISELPVFTMCKGIPSKHKHTHRQTHRHTDTHNHTHRATHTHTQAKGFCVEGE